MSQVKRGLYDVNPVPYGNELSLLVDNADNRISTELAIGTAPRFGISEVNAEKIAEEIRSIVRENWEQIAKKYGLPRGRIEDMRVAFSECDEKDVFKIWRVSFFIVMVKQNHLKVHFRVSFSEKDLFIGLR